MICNFNTTHMLFRTIDYLFGTRFQNHPIIQNIQNANCLIVSTFTAAPLYTKINNCPPNTWNGGSMREPLGSPEPYQKYFLFEYTIIHFCTVLL